ncbi:hypothetical protein [Streptomyces sp. MP131-18]|uniref:hypothetical protein n=1 Tax=Streptomyces sp. MP131-18 TaxID=1857892 RepID=UPI0009D5E2C8|nr:hypothetical protein [Streptomyces sp. MP131-18]ONK12635.1 hypothetical protein STBA_33830 [Streptomyces sp. MP131-18]
MHVRRERLMGVGGIEELFHACRTRPDAGEEHRRGRALPVVVLLGPRGSGKTVTLNHLGYLASRRPHALYDFASAAPRRPFEVAARLAIGLSHGFPRQPRLRFPRLALGLLVVRTGLSLDEAEPRRARAALRAALRQAREHTPSDEAAQRAGAALTLLSDLNLVQLPGLSLLVSLVQRGLPRLPVDVMWRTGLAWYGDQAGFRRIDALVALNQLGASEATGDRRAADRMLCAAFLEDLRAHYARYGRDRESVALLDNADSEQGRAFLDLLVEIREENAAERGVFDPLLVVATAAHAGRIPGPFAPGPAGLRTCGPEEASYPAWRERIPRPAPDTSWHWYPVRLRDLTANEVAKLGAEIPQLPQITPLVHRLSYGHPWSVAQLHTVARRAVARHGGETELRAVLDHPVPPPGAEGEAARELPLAQVALRYLLRDLSEDDQHAALIVCSAAREFDTAVDSGLLSGFVMRTQDTLLQEIGARLWLVDPVPEDAGAHGGRGSGYLLPTAHPQPLPGRPVLHPWLRLLLLRELAARPAGGQDWTAVHTALREWHRTHDRPLDAYYHSLALGELEPVVARLNTSLSTLPSTDEWLYELYAITAAPMRRPVDPDEPPSRRAPRLAQELAPTAFHEHRALSILVTSLWLSADPRNRLPTSSPELNYTIRTMFRELGVHSHARAAGLIHEAAKYEARL